MNDVEKLFAGFNFERDTGQEKAPAMAVELLQAFAENYAKPNPYKVGDWVTPRGSVKSKGVGGPHVVIEVCDSPGIDLSGIAGSNCHGNRLDIRVAAYDGNTITTHWVESHEFEPWVKP